MLSINNPQRANLSSSSTDLPYDGDAKLVTRYLKGEPEAFATIINRYKDAVFAVALSRLQNFHDAEDITQITFLEAFEQLSRLKESSNLGPWLRTIAINRSINFLNRRKRIVQFRTIDEAISDNPSPKIALEKKELAERVLEAVGQLSKTQRETVTLYYIGEHSIAEVATIQNIPLGTVKRRLHEARKKPQKGHAPDG